MNNSILILGANGQDGRLLCDYFDSKNIHYDIVVRNKYRYNSSNIRNIFIGDLNNYNFVEEIFRKNTYNKVFNFANETFVRDNNCIFYSTEKTKIFFNISRVIEEGELNFWFCQPLSSEIFGVPLEIPQNSDTKIDPINNYGLAKTIELHGSKILRSKGYRVFNPIFFNHESSYRDVRFFSAKAIQHFISYANNTLKQEVFKFHNAKSVRDWGYAKEFMELIIIASDKKINGSSVIGTGHQMSVLDFLKHLFTVLGIEVNINICSNSLIKIVDVKTNEIIAQEMGVNVIDEKRKFMADVNEIKSLGIDQPKIKGAELIKLLIDDTKKISSNNSC